MLKSLHQNIMQKFSNVKKNKRDIEQSVVLSKVSEALLHFFDRTFVHLSCFCITLGHKVCVYHSMVGSPWSSYYLSGFGRLTKGIPL